MSNDQIGELFNLLIFIAPFIYRIFFSAAKNSPARTRIRLANGYVNGEEQKRAAEELRLYREREMLADKSRDELLMDLVRWRSFSEQRYFEDRARDESRWRASEDSMRHFEEFTRLMVVKIQQLQDCCEGEKTQTQELASARHVPVLPPTEKDLSPDKDAQESEAAA